MSAIEKYPTLLSTEAAGEYQPKTPFGRRLWEIRQRVLGSGAPVLNWKDLELEIAERRGKR